MDMEKNVRRGGTVPPPIPPLPPSRRSALTVRVDPLQAPEPTSSSITEPVPTLEPAELFGEGENERTTVTAIPFELKPRFTGRRAAISDLEQMFGRARDSRKLGFALVVGEPGMGKSRLCGELATRAKATSPAGLVIAGAADDSGTPYGLVARALATRFGFMPGEPDAESRDRIQAGVAEVLPASKVPEVAHLLAHMMRVPFEDSPIVGPLVETPQRLETRMFMAVRRLLGAEAERRPLLVVLEDLGLCGRGAV